MEITSIAFLSLALTVPKYGLVSFQATRVGPQMNIQVLTHLGPSANRVNRAPSLRILIKKGKTHGDIHYSQWVFSCLVIYLKEFWAHYSSPLEKLLKFTMDLYESRSIPSIIIRVFSRASASFSSRICLVLFTSSQA